MKIYNSLSHEEEPFTPLEDGTVRMYNCGPTVYSEPHIGNFRSFLVADVLRRYLEYAGYDVRQVMNITDVGHLQENGEETEDKLEVAARREQKDVWEIADYYTDVFLDLIDVLNIKRADKYPRATQHVDDMIDVVKTLLDNGHAYEVDGEVYYDVHSFPEYGKLSRNTLEDLEAGHRIDVDPKKKDPRDFALWKQDPDHQMQWDSPWGKGFPGWHVECSTMANKYLGASIDVHTGGEDNIFPHHECEIAQAEAATGKPFVKYWVHIRHFLIDGEKMSKSLGNFYTVRDILEMGYDPEVLRLSLIRAHYRQNMNFRKDQLDDCQKQIDQLTGFRDRLLDVADQNGDEDVGDVVERHCRDAKEAFDGALADDLNVSGAIGALFEFMHAINRDRPQPTAGEAARVVDQLEAFDEVLAVLPDRETAELTPEQEELIEQREQARNNGNYERADGIRDELLEQGVVIEDTPEGTRWTLRDEDE